MNNLLSIFILTPGSIKRTRLVLESLKNQTFKDFDVVIGTDGIKSITNKAIKPYHNILDIKHVWLKDSTDFRLAGIYNKCLQKSNAKYCLCLNHDTLLPPKGAETLLKEIKLYGQKYFISPLRKEIDIKYLSKNIINNNFPTIENKSKLLIHHNVPYHCEPDSGGIISRKKALDIGGQFYIMPGISNVGEYKVRLRNEAGIKQKNTDKTHIIHIAHKKRSYLGNKHILQFVFRKLALEKIPRNYIIKYLENNPNFRNNLLKKAGDFKRGDVHYFNNLVDQARIEALQIALDYYKEKCKN